MKLPFKAAFFDLDGTLYQDQVLSKTTHEALSLLKKQAIHLGIASSRPLATMYDLPGLFDLRWDGIVAANGQSLYDHKTSLFYQRRIPSDQLDQIFTLAKQYQLPIYAVGSYPFLTMMNESAQAFLQSFHLDCPIIEPYHGQAVELITLISEQEVADLFCFPGLSVTRNGRYNTDIFLAEATKAQGIQAMMAHWHLEDQPYIAFGDSPSDRSMLQQASIGFAMAQADDQTKKVADRLCYSIDCSIRALLGEYGL